MTAGTQSKVRLQRGVSVAVLSAAMGLSSAICAHAAETAATDTQAVQVQSVIVTAKCQGLRLVEWLTGVFKALWAPVELPRLLPQSAAG